MSVLQPLQVMVNDLFMCVVFTGHVLVLSTSTVTEDKAKQLMQDSRWLLARRIARSSTFGRSEQLPKLLLYVCRMALSERVNEINEQRIGVEVFGRSPNYDPSVDGIVRSHATRLRQRLELYFNGEGSHEELRVEIPRGSYVPRFYQVESETPVAAGTSVLVEKSADTLVSDVPVASTVAEKRSIWEGWLPYKWAKPFFAGLLLAIAIAYVVHHLRRDAMMFVDRSKTRQTEIERTFWNSLFPANGRTLIVPGDSGLVLYETVTNHEVSLADYVDGNYRDPNRAKTIDATASEELTMDLASRRYTSFVDLSLSEQLSHLPQWSATRVSTVFARDLRPADTANSNLILIGSREANPWVSLAEPSMNFILIPDGRRGFRFLNRNPQKGELKIYSPQGEAGSIGASSVYGDVAYLPNPGGQGMILVLCGIWMSGTQSAGNFVLNGPQFSNWLKSIANPDGTIPPFELLIATKNLQGNATYSSIMAQRVRGK